jgi:hypothetical protein
MYPPSSAPCGHFFIRQGRCRQCGVVVHEGELGQGPFTEANCPYCIYEKTAGAWRWVKCLLIEVGSEKHVP